MRDVALPNVCQRVGRVVGTALVLALLTTACSRTGLYPADADEAAVEDPAAGRAGSTSGSGGGGGAAPTQGGSAPVEQPPGPICQPSPEVCNGQDDDCNGSIDDLPAEPCEGGGFSYCIAGRPSRCPERCEACVPGSVRICQNSFCSFWGEQQCAADGQGFGHCRELEPPAECHAVAKRFEDSRELEQCCIDNGYCCLDQFDLDGDGNRGEMLGACRDVACQ